MTRLCALADLDDPGSKAFTVERDGERLGVFVVRRGEFVSGWVNSCPHVGAPLDWQEGQFLDGTRTRIQCASHFAQFDIATGACLHGPCRGRGLQPFPVEIRDGAVWAVAPSLEGP